MAERKSRAVVAEEVVTVDPATGEVLEVRDTLAELERFYLGVPVASDDSPEATYRRISEQIMAATTVDEVLADVEATGARDVLDTPLEFVGCSWHQSTIEHGAPWYAAVAAYDAETREPMVVTCGARTVMKQLVRIMMIDRERAGLWTPGTEWTVDHIRGRLVTPEPVMVRQSRKPTKAGYWPLRLIRPPKQIGPV